VRTSGAAPPRRLASGVGHAVDRWRQAIRDRIQAQVDDRRAAGVLAALAVGDQGAIDGDDWDVFSKTGVAHLVSISGLHVTMFAWLAQWLVGLWWRRSGRLMLWWPAPTAGAFFGLLAATAYALFSGWGVPAQRTVWMLATAFALRGLSRRWPWPRVLLAAAVVVSALDPWALLQPGFWLSFMAVGLLMSSGEAATFIEPAGSTNGSGGEGRGSLGDVGGNEAAPYDRPSDPPIDEPPGRSTYAAAVTALTGSSQRWRGRLAQAMRAGLRAQLVATIGLAPLGLVFFHQLSLVGFVANLVAVPFVTLIVTPLALLGTALPVLWGLAAWMLRGFGAFLGLLASTPNALWSAPVAPLYAQVAGLAAGLLLVARLPWRLRLAAVPLVIPLLWPAVDRPAQGRFDVLAADVGQGTAVLVRTHAHVLLYDAGPKFGVDSDAGQRLLLPMLQAIGETRLDAMVVSHRDLDHVGGAASIADGVQVDMLLSSLEPDHPLLARLPVHDRCEAGQSWTWDGVSFEMLRPRESDYDIGLKPNAMSCVLKVTDRGRPSRSLLLTGDMERAQEEQLLESQPDKLAADILVAPHHGSRTSSTAPFLDATHAKLAVFQAAYRSRFGHPAPDVLQRYRDRHIAIVTSAECGAWRWSSADAAGHCQRDLTGRYWNYGVDD
jgi:competence protein ComEC